MEVFSFKVLFWLAISFKFYILGKKTEGAIGGVLQKKLFVRILQNSQENTFVGVSFLMKL